MQTRVIDVKWYSVALCSEHISAAILEVVCVTFQYTPDSVIALMHDRCAVNGRAFRDALALVFPCADDNDCMPHTVMHVGESLAHVTLDELMGLYNTENGHSNYFRQKFRLLTGLTAVKVSGTRWYGTQDAITKSVEPSLNNGKLLEVADWLKDNKYCLKTATKMVALLRDERKLTVLKVEAAVVSSLGIGIKSAGRLLEGDGYSQITGYPVLLHLKAQLESPFTARGLELKLAEIAASAPALPPPSVPIPPDAPLDPKPKAASSRGCH